MSKRFYPESYDKQADKLINGALVVGVVLIVLGIAGFLFVYCVGL